MGTYYDGTKLLSMTDLTGQRPEIYLTSGNRSIGKTTWFSRYAVKDFIKNLVVRDGIVIPNTTCRAPFAYAGAAART